MIEVKTTIGEETHKYLFRINSKPHRIFAILSLCFAAVSIVGIVLAAIFDFYEMFVVVLFVIAFLLLLVCPIRFLRFYLAHKSAYKSARIFAIGNQIYYRFEENKIFREATSSESHVTAEYEYSLFFKAIETNSYFILQLSNASTDIIFPKKDIVTGSVEELKQILWNHLGDRCISKNIK
ncbi:MAG: YcxB family protein [Firmicutes bacterium]|nr:YcxB family protein [Bacillota bacterium]